MDIDELFQRATLAAENAEACSLRKAARDHLRMMLDEMERCREATVMRKHAEDFIVFLDNVTEQWGIPQ
jgi:hypothetical protein